MIAAAEPMVFAQATPPPSPMSKPQKPETVVTATMPDKLTSQAQKGCHQCKTCLGYTAANDWRNKCSRCRCPKSSHDLLVIGSDCCAVDRIGFEPLISINKNNNNFLDAASSGIGGSKCASRAVAEAEGYTWIPRSIPLSRLGDWMKQIPDNKVPKLGSSGMDYRQSQLLHQLPSQDLSLKHCNHIKGKDQSYFQSFVVARNDIALDVGHAMVIPPDLQDIKCRKCKEPMNGADLAVVAPRVALKEFWHPGCFTCTTCEELLVDLVYCVFDDRLYCERHYAENLKPRCGACDELIFAGQYTKALGKDFHAEHFVCVSCNESLTGKRYVLTDEHPCCIPCYEQNFTHNCRVCERRIGLDSKDMSYQDLHWHEDCFKCRRCKITLVEKPFAAKNSLIFCAGCYDAEFATRCDACGDTFRPGMKKMEYKTRKWHDKCFQCVVCKTQVGSKPFIIPNETDVYCVGCFEEKFATKCTKCKKIMTTGGVTFKNEAWHRECFVCTNCQTVLAGQKFASRQDKPYCANCFGELFAKRCTSCSKPITGAGGTRFISFEGRHWHSQCFVCAMCQLSMAGKGFITDGEDIICPDCAKDKLMATSSTGN